MSGFVTVLEKIAEMWRLKKDELTLSGKKIVDIMEKSANEGDSSQTAEGESCASIVEDRFNEVVKIYQRNTDDVWGGFGS